MTDADDDQLVRRLHEEEAEREEEHRHRHWHLPGGVEIEIIICEVCGRPEHHRHPHEHRPSRVRLILGSYDPNTGVIQMTDTSVQPLTEPPEPRVISVALGPVTDATDHPVNDSVASLDAITPSDPTLAGPGAVATDGTLGGTVNTTGAEGTFTIQVNATSAAGLPLVGTSAPIVVAAGPAAKVVVNVVDAGPVAVPPPVEPPAA